ncbi:MAG: leucine-rich repeat domain-containing protein [Spirochaetales bacterium]|nr:leucine-rich repeat domain-containing protein [Spirochaetales bacterium]
MKKILLILSLALATSFTCFAANPASDFYYDMAPDGQGVMLKSYKGKSTTVVIPDAIEGLPVTQIGEKTEWADRFFQHTMYKSSCNTPYTITVPKSVKVIGNNAFKGVKGKINIDISNLTSIGKEAFAESDIAGTIKISKGMKFTGPDVFRKTKITAVIVEEGVTSLGYDDYVPDGTFMDCPNLKSVTLPASLTKINGIPFNGCAALPEVKIDNAKFVWGKDKDAFVK